MRWPRFWRKSRQKVEKPPVELPATLWIIEWQNRHLTVLLARDPISARAEAESRQTCGDDGWEVLDSARVRRIQPVESLSLNVSSRAELNRPKSGHVQTEGTSITWTGPHDGRTYRSRGDAPEGVLTRTARKIRVPSVTLWSYVWSYRELVLLTAKEFESACLQARSSGPAPTRGKVSDLVEPITKFELHLAEGWTGHAPTCYRLWIDGYKVGWPPTKDQEDRWSDPPPRTPLPAEIRLPIPRYAHTYAYGPGRPQPQ